MISLTVDFEIIDQSSKNSRSHCGQISKTRVTLIKINFCIHFRKFTFSSENRRERVGAVKKQFPGSRDLKGVKKTRLLKNVYTIISKIVLSYFYLIFTELECFII